MNVAAKCVNIKPSSESSQ